MKLDLERLEGRDTPASVVLSGTVLTVTSDFQSVVSVTRYGDDVYVSASFYDEYENYTHLDPIYDAGDVQTIIFNGGSDVDTFENNTAVPDFIYGNAGHDTLLGGSGKSYIEGGTGNDYIIGYAVNVDLTMVGGSGADGFHYRTGTRTQPYASEIYDYYPIQGDFTYA